jgi:hypothetical protein
MRGFRQISRASRIVRVNILDTGTVPPILRWTMFRTGRLQLLNILPYRRVWKHDNNIQFCTFFFVGPRCSGQQDK